MKQVENALSSESKKIEVEGIFSLAKEKKKKRTKEKESLEPDRKANKKKKIKKEKTGEKANPNETKALEDIDFWTSNSQVDNITNQEEISTKNHHKKKKEKKEKKVKKTKQERENIENGHQENVSSIFV